MTGGHVQVLAVGRDREAVGPFHLGGHLADDDLPLNGGPRGAEPDAIDLVGALGAGVDVVGRGGRGRHSRRSGHALRAQESGKAGESCGEARALGEETPTLSQVAA